MWESCSAFGGERFSYHPEVMFEGMASAGSNVYARGFPEIFEDMYRNGGGMIVDPVPDLIMQIGTPTFYNDAVAGLKLDERVSNLVETVRELGLDASIGFPLWGPKGQNAYASIGFVDPKLFSSIAIKAQHTLLLAGHQKIVELTSTNIAPSLSTREIEVLTWVARGKSNTDVGTILAISPDTVATYMRRIFNKLDSNDRIDAVLKALKMGLIRI